jgi:hypothetical protein
MAPRIGSPGAKEPAGIGLNGDPLASCYRGSTITRKACKVRLSPSIHGRHVKMINHLIAEQGSEAVWYIEGNGISFTGFAKYRKINVLKKLHYWRL